MVEKKDQHCTNCKKLQDGTCPVKDHEMFMASGDPPLCMWGLYEEEE